MDIENENKGPLEPLARYISELHDQIPVGSEFVELNAEHDLAGLPEKVVVLRDRKSGALGHVKPFLEQFRTAPERRSGTTIVDTLESFVELLNRLKTEDSVIFANTDWNNPSMTAIIDYHEVDPLGDADFMKHRVHYKFPLSDDWKIWKRANDAGEPMNQLSFAEFIEDRSRDFAAPTAEEQEEFSKLFGERVSTPSDIMNLSRGLSMTTGIQLKHNTRLASGETSLVFDQQHGEATDYKGEVIRVPSLFMIRIPIFHGQEPTRLLIRLRHRVREQRVTYRMLIYRPDVFIDEAVDEAITTTRIATELPVYCGIAPEAQS